jgi:hypothetical protein
MADQGSPPRIVRIPVAAPPVPPRQVRPPPVIVPVRRINFNNANRPIQMNPGGSPGRGRGGRRTRRHRKKSRKTYRKH